MNEILNAHDELQKNQPFEIDPEAENGYGKEILKLIDPTGEGKVVTDSQGRKYRKVNTGRTLQQHFSHEGPGWDFRNGAELVLGVDFTQFFDDDDGANQQTIAKDYPNKAHILNAPVFEYKPVEE